MHNPHDKQDSELGSEELERQGPQAPVNESGSFGQDGFSADSTMPSMAKIDEADPFPENMSDKVDRALIGKIIDDKFRVTDVLGKGGMSVVYKAQWVVFAKPVALKVMHSHLVNDQNALLRFKQEAKAAIELDHPSVIKAYQFGVTGGDSSKPYIVMDFIEGQSLSEFLKKGGRLPVNAVLEIFIQVADALAHAHQKGVIHRDLKPSNIMIVGKEGEKFKVKIVDFGIAKILSQEGEQAHRLTQTGDIFGSPLYMSPEQCMGRVVDKRSDVYALGCVLYECLSGRPPHQGGNVFETFHKHTTQIPASLSIPDAEKALVDRLDAIVFRALEKDPDKRYQSMSEFESDLVAVRRDLEAGLRGTNLGIGLSRSRRSLLRFFYAAPKVAMLAGFLVLVLALSSAFLYSKYSWFFSEHKFETVSNRWLDFVPGKRKKVKNKISQQERQKRLDNGKVAYLFAKLNNADSSAHMIDLWEKKAKECMRLEAPAEEIQARTNLIDILRQRSDDNSTYFVEQAEALAECLLNQGNFEKTAELFEETKVLRDSLRIGSPKPYIYLGYVYGKEAENTSDKKARQLLINKSIANLNDAIQILNNNREGDLAAAKIIHGKADSLIDSRLNAVSCAILGDDYMLAGKHYKADQCYATAESLSESSSSKSSTILFLKEIALARAFANIAGRKYKDANSLFAGFFLDGKLERFEDNKEDLKTVYDAYSYSAWRSGDLLKAAQLHELSIGLDEVKSSKTGR